MRARICLAGIVVVAFAILLGQWFGKRQTAVADVESRPFPARTDGGFVTSDACVSCHPSQHTSWHRSYHRTMTQVATPDTVVAPFDNVLLETDGQTAKLERRGDEFWVDMLDPIWEREKFAEWAESRAVGGLDPFESFEGTPPRLDAKVVMTTGSHHFQAYWVRGAEGREMVQFPWRFHLGEKRWIHRKDAFLAPPEWRPGMWARTWNHQCSICHSTGPYPGENPATGVMEDTQIAEFGIACEACHGPAEEHVRFHQTADSPLAPDPIVNPAKLDHQRSSEVCGQCHSHFTHSDPLLNIHGPQFRPGKNLYHFGTLAEPSDDLPVMAKFWGDGANRSGGREFSGMSTSECYLEGQISCVHCHSMHESDPDDQLSKVGMDNEACLQCHSDYRDRLVEHTHHEAHSSGSQCVNCHMPHTNYALFKAIRSHHIDVPKVVSVKSNSRPNACNLCHLDQTLSWTSEKLADWYDVPPAALAQDEKQISAAILWALKGDAGQRVIAAWHFGWEPARSTSGDQWIVPTIAALLKDPYAAVRWVAYESLRKVESFSGTEFNFDSKEDERNAVADAVLQAWHDTGTGRSVSPDRATRVLLKDGEVDHVSSDELLLRRDNRLMSGVE